MYMSLLFICSGRSLLFFLEYLYFHMLGWISGFGHIASSVLATHVSGYSGYLLQALLKPCSLPHLFWVLTSLVLRQ